MKLGVLVLPGARSAKDNLSTIVEYWRRCAAETKDQQIRKKHEEDGHHLDLFGWPHGPMARKPMAFIYG